jgi:SAM-dependent methyltransferase
MQPPWRPEASLLARAARKLALLRELLSLFEAEPGEDHPNAPSSFLQLNRRVREVYFLSGFPVRSPRIDDLQLFIDQHARSVRLPRPWTSIDLGCGFQPRNPFGADTVRGLDVRRDPEGLVQQADLFTGSIPLADASVEIITAFDFLEHVPRTSLDGRRTSFPFVRLMQEIFRVLRPGGVLLSHTPAYPAKQAFQDPTHVNIVTEDTFPIYFCRGEGAGTTPLAAMYGFSGAFRLIAQGWRECWLVSLMQKPEPAKPGQPLGSEA